jgi:hypothetical protein
MKKSALIIAGLLLTFSLSAQDQPAEGPIVKSSLAQMLRLQATITPAWSVSLLTNDTTATISSGKTRVYLHTTAEYYWDERVSMRGDLYFLLVKDGNPGGMKHNHGFQVGLSYHLLKKSNIDPFIGVRAGLNYTQVQAMNLNDGVLTALNYNVPAHIDPTWAPVAGINFYGQRVFHFFIEAAYMNGTYRPSVGPQMSLEEIRLSAGLGWNFSLYKPVDSVRQKI